MCVNNYILILLILLLVVLYFNHKNKDEKTCVDLFRFYEYCRTKLIEGVSSLNYKDIFKSVVNLDKMFNFRYIN